MVEVDRLRRVRGVVVVVPPRILVEGIGEKFEPPVEIAEIIAAEMLVVGVFPPTLTQAWTLPPSS